MYIEMLPSAMIEKIYRVYIPPLFAIVLNDLSLYGRSPDGIDPAGHITLSPLTIFLSVVSDICATLSNITKLSTSLYTT